MEYAQTLIRSVVRSFYLPESVLIIDAVLLHSALRDDDLAHLMGSQTKHVRKLCIRLRDDGLLNVHSRPEIKQGANKAFNRDYYFINYHHAIDVIKYRLKNMTREVEKRFGQKDEEKKEYFCDRCKSEYTQMEVLDTVGPDGQFACKRCGNVLRQDHEQKSVGHEMQSRLNAQLAAFEKLMRQIDDVRVPENDFEVAIANARPVHRDPSLNPIVKSEVAPPRGNMPAATVYGMKTEQDKIQVSLHDEAHAKKEAEEAAARKAKLAEQNALPSWYTTSTITGEQTALGMKEEAARREREADGLGGALSNGINEEEKKPIEALQDNSQLGAYFAALREEEMKRQQEEEDEDEEDEEDSDDDNDDGEDDENDFEDVAMDATDGAPPSKRVKIEEPGQNPLANAVLPSLGDDSAAVSASTSTGNSTPLIVAAAAATNDANAPINETPKEGSGEDSDEDEFEDVEV